MKLQGVSVLFALIVLPLILVLSYYIRLQVETINLQNQYDAKLLNSTRDALSAFEINTANEDLSTVSDSLRTIIEASSNVFINTLATNLGMSNASKNYIEPYVPSLLYTLYDGYYIYAPTRVPIVLTDSDGNAVAVGDSGVKINGSDYTYTVAHPTQASEDECAECKAGGSGHIKYANYSDVGNYLRKNDPGFVKQDYGQILYQKKKANPSDPTVYTTNIADAELKTKNVLKSYMPYSARYKRTGSFDISVVYTLDNFITIEGTIDDIYYTKSGYLLPNDCYNATGADIIDLMKYSQEDAKKQVESGKVIELEIANPNWSATVGYDINDKNQGYKDKIVQGTTDYIKLTSGGHGSYDELSRQIIVCNTRIDNAHYYKLAIQVGAMPEGTAEITDFITKTGLTLTSTDTIGKLDEIVTLTREERNNLQYELDKISAMTYYVSGIIFTEWVQANLGGVLEKDLVEIAGQEYRSVNGSQLLTYNFEESDDPIFAIEGQTEIGITEVPIDSVFATHKLNVIRNSIQYNLNLAMSTYNTMTTGRSTYAMPIMEEEEWIKVLTNPSIVSFLQGYHCGLKTYNNYMIVSSTNNEISVSAEDLYFVDKADFSNELSEYHKIDCPKLLRKGLAGGVPEQIGFASKDAKYDKVYNKHNSLLSYRYDHKNFACYDCINDGNYEENQFFEKATGVVIQSNGMIEAADSADIPVCKDLLREYYIGIGKCRNNLYKMNAVSIPQGYEIIYEKNKIAELSTLPLKNVKAVEIVLGTIKTTNPQESVLQYQVGFINNSNLLTNEIYAISSNVTVENTIVVRLDPNLTITQDDTQKIDGTSINLYFDNLADGTTAYVGTGSDADGDGVEDKITDQNEVFKSAIKYIRIIYK